ncbi:MAG: hypothetical protein HZB16_05645 [Armatimonadetes bacterium]|nr:hypothetical protein [Armatimonadota bacterium]
MRRVPRVLAAIGLVVAISLLAGCAGLTGGSIPPGGGLGGLGRATGVIVRGDNANSPLVGASLRFLPKTNRSRVISGGGTTDPPTPPDWGGGGTGGTDNGGTVTQTEPTGTVHSMSGSDGTFAANQLVAGPNWVEVTPPTGSGLARTYYTLTITGGMDYYLYLAPLPTSFTTVGFTGIQVTPETIDVSVGMARQIGVAYLGGAPPTVVPSMLVSGNCGVISTYGEFVGVQSGQGSVLVKVGPYEKTLPVRVH